MRLQNELDTEVDQNKGPADYLKRSTTTKSVKCAMFAILERKSLSVHVVKKHNVKLFCSRKFTLEHCKHNIGFVPQGVPRASKIVQKRRDDSRNYAAMENCIDKDDSVLKFHVSFRAKYTAIRS